MRSFTYQGRRVIIPPTAMILPDFRPEGRYANLVQELLDAVDPWKRGEDPIETLETEELVLPCVAEVKPGMQRLWGIHYAHWAKTPGLSPFVRHDPTEGRGNVTIELSGTPDKPLLVCAYGGDYVPPLPWMVSAKRADGGVAACLRFWQSHAYRCLPRGSNIRPGSMSDTPPAWFQAA